MVKIKMMMAICTVVNLNFHIKQTFLLLQSMQAYYMSVLNSIIKGENNYTANRRTAEMSALHLAE